MSGFGMSKEGASSVRPPLLTGDNYSSWKGKMEAYICQIHDRSWMAVEDGYAPPMMTPTDGGEEILKPKAQWSPQEFTDSMWNNKAIHAIRCAMNENQYKLIQITRIAKEAWEILEVAHEGTEVVKDSKLQVFQTRFETIRMEEHEHFNDFQVRLMDIVNQSHQLGDPYSDRRIKQKIMRSLPERFEPKVTALEENDTYKEMKPSEVIGRPLAYESRKATTSPPKKKKDIALKTSKIEEEEDDSYEDMALIAKGFKKFLNLQKSGYGSKGNDFKKKKTTIKNVKPYHEMSSREKIQCYECGGFGHISKDCANLEDEREEVATSSDSDEEVVAKFLALGCSHKRDNKVKVVEGSPSSLNDCENNYFAFPISYNEEENESQEESDSNEDDSSSNSTNGYVEKKVLDEYLTEFKSLAMKTKEKIRRLREENLDLLAHVDHLSEQVDRSKNIEDKLRKELDLSKRNKEDLKRELEEAKGSRTRIVSSTEKLDHMLSAGKSPCDKRGLGFEDGKETSTPSKTVFVKSLSYKEASPVQTPRKKIDLGQCSHSAQVKVDPRRQPQAQPTRVPYANFPQTQLHQGKRPIMQTQPRKQPSLG
ncbi:hypothetical protein LWI29_004279 [Acer saccharum]|uniref:CCHC-type domain-containing protein n=1 Tax=Acer saccharum TaxID=4024 RepID=A0AA39SI04_ACESA|nr:hypothetical protein LWI29_004279 [Acer saccharum]